MTVYTRQGSALFPSDERANIVVPLLPVGNYIIKATPQGQLYFDSVDSFTRPSKIYGDTVRNAERVMSTFIDRKAGTGILLNGEKGSGKTLLAKMLAIRAAELDMPTIIINAPWRGDAFNQLLQNIEQPAVVLFDEFEKIYDRDEQKEVLTLFDGVFPSKKLFILTCNDKYAIDAHMRNRPGRMFYMMDFEGLDQTFIREYCEDRLNDTSHIDKICQVAVMFSAFNFDMLQGLVEEMNRYNEDPYEALKMLNVKPQSDSGGSYQVFVDVDGFVMEHLNDDGSLRDWNGSPLSHDRINLDLHMRALKPGEEQPPSNAARKPQSNSMRSGGQAAAELRTALAQAQRALIARNGGGDVSDDNENESNVYLDFYLERDSLVKIDTNTESFLYRQGPVAVTFRRKKLSEYRFQNYDVL